MTTKGPQLREAHWPADTSQPVLETTVGGVRTRRHDAMAC